MFAGRFVVEVAGAVDVRYIQGFLGRFVWRIENCVMGSVLFCGKKFIIFTRGWCILTNFSLKLFDFSKSKRII